MHQPDRLTYFLTGANGFIGRQVCELLLARGHRVKGLVRGKAPMVERMGVELVRGDLAHASIWTAGLKEVDVVIHCAANARFGNGPNYEAENVRTTANLLDAIHTNAPRLRRFVFVSTVGAVDRAAGDKCLHALDETSPPFPSSDYGRSKLLAEALVASSGLPFVIVRSALATGGGMRADSHFAVFARWALDGHPLARIAWTGRFSVVDVEDLAEALLVCASHPEAVGGTFFCGGHSLELGDYFDMVRPATRIPLQPFVALFRLIGFALPFKLKSMLLPALVVDDGALRRLGWRPRRMPAESLGPVIQRERARVDPAISPPLGQTVVTGAASGLGRAMADRLAAQRSHLLLIDRDGAGLAELSRQIPHARCLTADLADERGWGELLDSPQWRAFPVVELYACAGVGRRGTFAEDAVETQIDMMRVNLLARMRLAHAVIADMTRLQIGRIVLIASSSAFQPLPLMTVYAASNAGLLFFGEGLAHELAHRGIHVMTVCPGGMQTNFQKTANVKQNTGERLMSPVSVAAEIMRGLVRRETTLVISGRARAMALLARLIPRALSLRLWGHLMAALR